MNICCTICSDLIIPSDDSFNTPCGHVFHYTCLTQWLERSQTCPQCRDRVTENKIRRLYFNLSNEETIVESSATLQATVENQRFQLCLKEKDLKQYQAKFETLNKQASGLKAEVKQLESKLTERTSAIYGLQGQLKLYKQLSSSAEGVKKEAVELKKKLEQLRSIQVLVDASNECIDEAVRNNLDLPAAWTYIGVLKRELISSVSKRKEIRDALKKSQEDLSKVTRERNLLTKEHTLRQRYGEELNEAENLLRIKDEKIRQLERIIESQRAKYRSIDVSDTTNEVDLSSPSKSPDLSANRRGEIRDALKKLQEDLSKVTRERNLLTKEHTLRQRYGGELNETENLLRKKDEKIRQLQRIIESQRAKYRSIDVSDTTNEVDLSSPSKSPDLMANTKVRNNAWDIADLRLTLPVRNKTHVKKRSAVEHDIVDLTEGTSVAGNAHGNEENSPYLSYKTYPGGVMGTMRPQANIPAGLSANSILAKKPRLAQSCQPSTSRDSSFAFDGFGGSSVPEIFPIPITSSPKKSHRGPRQRPKPDSGLNKRISNFMVKK